MTERFVYTETQHLRNRRLQQVAERQGRLLGLILAIEIVGFSITIILELVK